MKEEYLEALGEDYEYLRTIVHHTIELKKNRICREGCHYSRWYPILCNNQFYAQGAIPPKYGTHRRRRICYGKISTMVNRRFISSSSAFNLYPICYEKCAIRPTDITPDL